MLDAATRKPIWRHSILDADGICSPGETSCLGSVSMAGLYSASCLTLQFITVYLQIDIQGQCGSSVGCTVSRP